MMAQYTSFNKAANGVISDPMARSRIIAAAVAVAIANQASLPTAPVDSPTIYFASSVLGSANSKISQINEKVIFDYRLALDYARSLWLLRYNSAFPTTRPIFAMNYTFFESVVGLSNFVAPEVVEFFNANKVAILSLATAACEVMDALASKDRANA